jgi:hypothetical protein
MNWDSIRTVHVIPRIFTISTESNLDLHQTLSNLGKTLSFSAF